MTNGCLIMVSILTVIMNDSQPVAWEYIPAKIFRPGKQLFSIQFAYTNIVTEQQFYIFKKKQP